MLDPRSSLVSHAVIAGRTGDTRLIAWSILGHLGIWLGYTVIASGLYLLIHGKKAQYRHLYYSVAAFIFFAGFQHLMAIGTMFAPYLVWPAVYLRAFIATISITVGSLFCWYFADIQDYLVTSKEAERHLRNEMYQDIETVQLATANLMSSNRGKVEKALELQTLKEDQADAHPTR